MRNGSSSEVVELADLPAREPQTAPTETLRQRQIAFGYTQEDMKVTLAPLARNAEEAVSSMGNDTPLAVLSSGNRILYSYFKQLFAQVTNPPIDSIREAIVMSLSASIGSEKNLLAETPEHARQLALPSPILLDAELEQLRQVHSTIFKAHTLDTTWPVSEGTAGLDAALERLCREADAVLAVGVNILILSDRAVGPDRAPVPALLAVAAVHHHLVREGTRLQAGLVVETGEARSVHSIATLIGYGAAAVNPYLMLETLGELVDQGLLPDGMTAEVAQQRAVKGIGKGILKTLSKMGISTVPSYCGAQIFEAVGLAPELVDRHFTGTASRIGGIGTEQLAREMLARHARAYPGGTDTLLPVIGLYAWRRDGEHHQWNPETIALLQDAVRNESFETYEAYARAVNDDAVRRLTLRGLLRFREADDGGIPLEDVEPASEIVKRFVTGAMSLGSISREAHENLAIAMNRIGGKSNTGEGGEDPVRFTPDANGDLRRSAIKQVASGRFGVTIDYLTNADEIQIKMAQGAKPGEGGQLPGHKVDRYIASVRLTTPGVGLISPPPHHDIYSIEDLKQLIYDLRCANPTARISVKLVAEVGVGTVAAGVAKANADHVLISGHDGGTGASPLSSILFAGIPWEIGLAETQQTLVRNDLRSRIWVQTDGQIKTGRDVVVAALLGADEIGFATAPLVASGCVMMRACHLNTCPVGIATQDPVLRARFAGQPEHVVNFFFYVAEEARQIMARLGIRALRGSRRPGRASRGRRGDRALAGARHRPVAPSLAHGSLGGHSRAENASAGLPARRRARLGADRGGGAGHREGRARRAVVADPQSQQDGRRASLAPRDEGARQRRPAGRLDPRCAHRVGRAVLRRLARSRDRALARRRCQRLRRQGALGRNDLGAPARRRGLPRRGERRHRQHGALRCDVG